MNDIKSISGRFIFYYIQDYVPVANPDKAGHRGGWQCRQNVHPRQVAYSINAAILRTSSPLDTSQPYLIIFQPLSRSITKSLTQAFGRYYAHLGIQLDNNNITDYAPSPILTVMYFSYAFRSLILQPSLTQRKKYYSN